MEAISSNTFIISKPKLYLIAEQHQRLLILILFMIIPLEMKFALHKSVPEAEVEAPGGQV
jgi:hypothetical protein